MSELKYLPIDSKYLIEQKYYGASSMKGSFKTGQAVFHESPLGSLYILFQIQPIQNTFGIIKSFEILSSPRQNEPWEDRKKLSPKHNGKTLQQCRRPVGFKIPIGC